MPESWPSRVLAWAIVAAVAAGLGAFLYAAIFRAREWSHPAAARGAGVGTIGLLVLGLGAWLHSGLVEAAGGLAALAGLAWAASGLGD
ncbi:MAG: hypothetical protein PHU21_06785 [Elusimicrobia bacterium]|nr:hypothetical protein [Elusimicrobiota bacterium]